MDDAGAVGIAESGAGLDDDWQGVFGVEFAEVVDHDFEVGAGDVFHDDEQFALVETKVMDSDNVGVGEVGDGFGFLSEADLDGGVGGVVGPQHFNGDESFQHEVAGAEDLGHAACAERFKDLVAIVQE